MVIEYGVYEQGAMFFREDFDPVKTINYFCKMYEIEMTEEIKKEIETDTMTDEHFDFLCEKLEVNPEERTLQSMCTQTLNPYEIYDLLLENADVKIGNDMVYASVYSNLVGDFIFYDKDKPWEHIDGDCMMLCFNVPYAWDIKDANIPADKNEAVRQLKDATKSLLKDDINWEDRLGSLLAAGYNS